MKQKLKTYIKNVFYSLKIIHRIAPILFWMQVIFTALFAALPYLSLYFLKELTNAVVLLIADGTGTVKSIIGFAVWYGLSLLITDLVRNVSVFFSFQYGQEVSAYLDNLVIEKMAHVQYGFFDSSDLADRLSYSSKTIGSIVDIEALTVNVIYATVQLIASGVLLISGFPFIVPIVLLLTIPVIKNEFATQKENRAFDKTYESCQRRQGYFKGLFFSPARLEIMLYGLQDFFLSLYNKEWKKFDTAIKQKNKRQLFRRLTAEILMSLSDVVFYFYLAVLTVRRVIGVGDLAYNISLLSHFSGNLKSFISSVARFGKTSDEVDDVLHFMDMEAISESGKDRIPSAMPVIAFENVTFRYPGQEKNVLEHCSFTINTHEKVGLVGENGCGKSTILKLLLRLYDPTEGKITIDGVDIREYDLNQLRKRFGVLFQDHTAYSMTARENVMLSDVDKQDEAALIRACEDSCVSEIAAIWDNGMDTPLTKRFYAEGIELSGGQWQRVSLARALYRDAPVVLLDEPSASLDPIAEYEIFRNFQLASAQKSALLISHRLSNIVMCDRILVMEHGRIVENGSHRQLMEKNGKYAHMFSIQAKRYSVD